MRRKLLLGVGAAVVAVCASASALAAGVGDGGFETPIVPDGGFQTIGAGSALGDWNVVGGDVYLVSTDYAGLAAEEGVQWLSLSAAAGAGVEQTIATTPGGDFTLSFWAGNAVATSNTLEVQIGADIHEFTDVPGFDSWAQYSVSFTGVGSATSLAFYNGVVPYGRPGLDNISITSPAGDGAAVPEPAAWVMILAGFGGIGALLRRHGAQLAATTG